MIKITVGDTEFIKTLTDKERDYIYAGCNWLGKFGRECTLKSIHKHGYNLEEFEKLSEAEQKNILET